MFSVLVIFALISCVAAIPLPDNEKIVNGTNAYLGEFPYIVSLRKYGSHSCGGSILNQDYVLTAAHCVTGTPASIMSVQYGVVKISNYGNVIPVENFTYHENYSAVFLINDVAVIKLASPLPLDGINVSPIVLPPQNDETPGEAPALLAGWGTPHSGGNVMTHLQKVDIKIYSDHECEKAHQGATSRNYHICAGVPEGGKGQCNGDSGGPLTVKGVQFGIVSWSIKPCTIKGFPGVFCKVANYIEWIQTNANL